MILKKSNMTKCRCALYSIDYMISSIFYALYSMHFNLRLYYMHYNLCSTNYMHCTMRFVFNAFYFYLLYAMLCIVFYALFSANWILFFIFCGLFTLNCVLCINSSILVLKQIESWATLNC